MGLLYSSLVCNAILPLVGCLLWKIKIVRNRETFQCNFLLTLSRYSQGWLLVGEPSTLSPVPQFLPSFPVLLTSVSVSARRRSSRALH